ncbi:MAG TPA: hypothetical protein VK716_13145 [Terracidiphilus sp.]|nr:hypothetical protein [Terracidiphilus sp.]
MRSTACWALRPGLGRVVLFFTLSAVCFESRAKTESPAESLQNRIAKALIAHREQTAQPDKAWGREQALELEGMSAAWYNTANGDDYRYVKNAVDQYLDAVQKGQEEKPGDAAMGEPVLLVYRVTLQPKYYEAAAKLRAEASLHCEKVGSNSESSCPDAPFLAEFAAVFQDPEAFAAITRALVQWDQKNLQTKDNADRSRGDFNSFGWEAKSIVDALPFYSASDPGREELLRILRRIAALQPASAPRSDAGLLAYARMKGARLGYLPEAESKHAETVWNALQARLLKTDAAGGLLLDDSTGAVLLTAAEAEHVSTASIARNKTAVMDAWFNSQERKNAAGQMELFHYKWDDRADSGYSLLGHMLRGYGMRTTLLAAEPTAENLRLANYYFIASPDIPVKNPNPHYMTEAYAAVVAAWVKQGGVLVMMENDPPNADIEHLNLLADRFGIHFDNVLHHHILGEQVADGTIPVAPGGPLFEHAHTLYMKDTCAISLRGEGQVLLRDRGDIVMASIKFGRGTVFAAVDPWVYNEYTDGRKNPKIYGQFDNFAGGMEFVRWLAHQGPPTRTGTGTKQKEQP